MPGAEASAPLTKDSSVRGLRHDPVQGERVVIRPLRRHDLPAVYSARGDRTRSANRMTLLTADLVGDL